MKKIIMIAALGCVACGHETSVEQQDMLDQQAVEMVEQANNVSPPLEEVTPEPILYPDIERYDIYGASCAYAPGTSLGARVIARQADAFMKVDGEILRFAADPGARELPYGTRSLYNGREYSLRLEIAGGGDVSGEETVDYEGTISLRDRWDRVVYRGSGTAQCGV
ncbi:hypothetical protein GCM10009127_19590 [Alteraurantiacibacter aestuarii]|uniref:hypothetical protein n=1 Tax=Alteraurantiacibacter aestuarii TaxID=650004 RepID=UPI0031E32B0B